MAKVYSVTIRNGAGTIALATGIVAIGVVLLTVGFALLASLAVVGGVLGAGFGLYHRLRGGRPALPRGAGRNQSGLDPTLEVQPMQPALIRPRTDSPRESAD